MGISGSILLLGIQPNQYKIFCDHFDRKYKLMHYERQFNINVIDEDEEVLLFIVNMDQPFLHIDEITRQIKAHPKFQNCPIIAMAMKNNFGNLKPSSRLYIDDFILTPHSWEDMLIRVEVWINTYHFVVAEEADKITYSIDSMIA